MKILSDILIKAGLIVEGTTDLQGVATAVTQTSSDSSTKLATTAFVKNQAYAVDSAVVHTTGDEIIAGVKTFTGSVYAGNSSNSGTLRLYASGGEYGQIVKATGGGLNFTIFAGANRLITFGTGTDGLYIDNGTGNVTLNYSASGGRSFIARVNNSATSNGPQIEMFQTATYATINAGKYGGTGVAVPLTLAIDGSQKVIVFTDGNTAIGSATNAGYKLDVAGTLRATGVITTSSTYGFTIGDLAGAARIAAGTSGANSFTLLTAANGFADLYANAGTFNGNIQARVYGGLGYSGTQGQDVTVVGHNIGFTTTASTYTYKLTGDGAFIRFISGGMELNSIPSGTLGATITGITQPFKVTSAGAGTFSSSVTATSFVKSGGTASQFLKADGSVDSNTYLTTSSASSTYLPLSGGTITGILNINSVANPTSTNVYNNGDFISNWIGNSTSQLFSIRNVSTTGVFLNTQNSAPLVLGVSTGTTGGTIINHLSIDSTGAATFASSVTATSFIKSGGTSSQFLKADGSVDSTSYQGAITLTTTGTSGAATLVGNTLNIPQYSGGGGGGVTTTGTPITNYITKFTGSSTISNSLIYDDGTNVGIGTTTFTYVSAGRLNLALNGGSTGGALIEFKQADVASGYLFSNSTTMELNAVGARSVTFSNNGSVRATITSGGLFGIGTATIGSQLQVNGNAAIGYSSSTAAPTNGLVVSGIVGIGTTTTKSYSSLTVQGQLVANSNLCINSGQSLRMNMYYNSGTVTDRAMSTGYSGDFILNSSTGDWQIRTTTASTTADTNITTMTTRVNITSAGLFGINTTTIGSQLQVNGNAAIGYSASTAAPTNGLVVAGSIGVGFTTTPNWKLEVKSTDNINLGAAAFQGVYSTTDYIVQRVASGTTGYGAYTQYSDGTYNFSIGTATNGDFTFFSARYPGAAGTERARIAQNGQATFSGSITAASAVARGAIFQPTLVAAANNDVLSAVYINPTFTNGAFTGVSNFALDVTGAGASRFTKSSSSTLPTLYVAGGSDATGGGKGNIRSSDAGGANYYDFGRENLTTGNFIITSNGGSPLFSLTSGGNLGLGTTTIGSKLQVNGNAAIGYSASTAAPTNGLAVYGDIGYGLESASQFPALFPRGSGVTDWFFGKFDATAQQLRFALGNGAGSVSIGKYVTSTYTSNITLSGGGANVTSIGVTGYSLTGANAQSLLDLSGTWNTTGNPSAIKLNITNTASGSTSKLMDLQVGGSSQFAVTKAGIVYIGTTTSSTWGSKFVVYDGSVTYSEIRSTSQSSLIFSTSATSATPYTEIFNSYGNFGIRQNNATYQPYLMYYDGTSDYMYLQTANYQALRIFNSQNVLLGTGITDAGFKLDVNGTARFSGQLNIESSSGSISGARNALYLKNTNSTGNQSNTIVFGSAGTASSWEILNDIVANGTTVNQLDILNAGTSRLKIASSGAATFSGTLGINGISDNVKGSTYTPTITNMLNGSALSINSASYVRVGNTVIVSAYFSFTTSSTYTSLYLSIPVGANFSSSSQARGSGAGVNGASIFRITSNSTTSNVIMEISTPSASSYDGSVTFQYDVQ